MRNIVFQHLLTVGDKAARRFRFATGRAVPAMTDAVASPLRVPPARRIRLSLPGPDERAVGESAEKRRCLARAGSNGEGVRAFA